MLNTKQLLLMELDYSAWANRRLLSASAALTPEELDQDLGASHRSVLGTLRHIFDAEQVWSERVRSTPLPPLIQRGDQVFVVEDRPSAQATDHNPEPGLEALHQRWANIWTASRLWLEQLPEEKLDLETSCLRKDGQHISVSRARIILHMLNHSTMHRGQVMNMLRSLGKQPPNTDIFSFYMLT